MVVNAIVLDSGAGAKKASKEAPTHRDLTLRVLYCMSSGLSLLQVLSFFMNKSARISMGQIPKSSLPEMERQVARQMQQKGGMTEGGGLFFARALLHKYYGHKLVGITHILAAPLWAAIIPFQLHPASRSPPYKKLHRTLGSAFFALSASLTVGVAAILGRGLQMQVGAAWAGGADGKLLRRLPLLLRSSIVVADPFMVASSTWFVYTFQRSLRAAWKKRFAEHEDWVLRHIASGQWVSLMRILVGVIMPMNLARYGDAQAVLVSAFNFASLAAWAMCFAGAEVAVARVRANRVTAKAVSAARRNLAQESLNEAELPVAAMELGA